MTTAIVFYILLLLVFLIISSLIFRHTIKFSYLSPRFRYIVGVFAAVSFVIIIFSVYLLFQIDGGSSTGSFKEPTSSSSSGSSSGSGDLNF